MAKWVSSQSVKMCLYAKIDPDSMEFQFDRIFFAKNSIEAEKKEFSWPRSHDITFYGMKMFSSAALLAANECNLIHFSFFS